MNLEDVAVLDAGSCYFKAGMAESYPVAEPPIMLAGSVTDIADIKETSQPGSRSAVEQGATVHWDAYETILDHILYKKLGWEVGNEGNLVAGESLFTPRAEREQLTQLAFEHNNVAGFFLCDQAVLSLYALGKLSGCVVDIGHTKTDGQLVPSGSARIEHGMYSAARQLQELILKSGGPTLEASALQTLRDSIVRVPESKDEADKLMAQTSALHEEFHKLPDGQEIKVGLEGVVLGEALLDGRHAGLDGPSVADTLNSCCLAVQDSTLRKSCQETLVVCGGGSQVAGLPLRVLKDFGHYLAPSTSPALVQAPDYAPAASLRHSVWMGGAILAKGIVQQNQFMTKYEYNEYGPAAIHRRCP